MKIIKSTFFFIITAFFISCNLSGLVNEKHSISDFEFKGVVLAHIHNFQSGYGSTKSKSMHEYLKNIGYDSVQLNTFGYMQNRKSTDISYKNDPTLNDERLVKEIQNLNKKGMKVALKPHIWIGDFNFDPDNWRNRIDFDNKKDLDLWFENYSDFIMDQAKLAEKTGVSLFVVGTELASLVKYDEHWKQLIKDVRAVYNGKITYAAEGSNAGKVKFWNKLDYIGIDAYFSLSKKSSPEVEELISGWESYNKEFKKLSNDFNMKIIFTEVGYKSVTGTSVKPWQWMDKNSEMSEKAQANCYRAMFEFIKNKPYMAGIFIWKYFTDMDSHEERGNIKMGFTPYKKEAEKIVSDYFLPNT